MAVDEDLSSMTVPALKEKLKEAGLGVSGNKDALITRLKNHRSKEAPKVEAKKEEAKGEVPKPVAKEEEKKEEANKDTPKVEAKKEEANTQETKEEEPKQSAKDETKGDAARVAPDVEMKTDGEEKPQEPAEPEELESDSLEDKRPKIGAGAAVMGAAAVDATLNVMSTCEGKVLTSLTDGGFQHFVAATRSSVGVKAGRYFYEVRIVEARSYLDGGKHKVRQSCCLGFSTARSSLFLGDGVENVGFDSDGHFVSAGAWSEGALYQRFDHYSSVYGVLLNLDQNSPNANTVSLFRDGVRKCKPQPLPECIKGKALYPTVNYKGMTLHVNLGPCCMAPLPFSCGMLQDAAKDDAVISPKPGSEQAEVIFPVGLPEEGTFEWLDGFLKENPQYTEISNRAILDWGLKSGLFQQQQQQQLGSWPSCSDRPSMDFGIREIDDYTLLKTVQSLAPMFKRDYVVMEVRNNLLAEERSKVLSNLWTDDFKKTAIVVMGEPPQTFKEKAHMLLLEEKKKQVASEVRRKKTMEAAERRKAKKAAEEIAAAEKKEDGAEEAEPEKEQTEEDTETIEEAIKKATEAVELSEHEKSAWFPKLAKEDLTKKDLCRSFSSFSIPTKEEGFDELKFAWQPAPKATEYLKAWVAEKKLTQRIEDLQPGARFKEQLAEWNKALQDWRRRHSDRRDPVRRKQAAKKQRVEEDDEAEGGNAKDDPEGKDNGAEEEETKMEHEPAITADDVDPCVVEDIDDIGNGEPLYANFTWEDWTMLVLRFELHLLLHSFRGDVDDPERPSFHETHLPFYYYKYYKKQLNVKSYGVDSNVELLKLVQDTIEVLPKKSILDPQLSEDTPVEIFVRLTEDHRRERQHRFDAGDEGAALCLQRPPPRPQQQQQQPWGRVPWDGGKGKEDYRGRGEYPNRPPPPSYGGQYGGRNDGYKGSNDGSYKGARAPPAIGQPVRKGGLPASRDDGGRSDTRGRDQQSYKPGGNRDVRGSSGGGYPGGYSRDGPRDGPREGNSYREAGSYPRDSRGPAPVARSRSPPVPPPAAARPAPGPSSYSGGNQRKNYAPPSSSSSAGGYGSQSYNKPRTSYGSSGPPPSRGGGGSSYGGSSYGSSGGYRR